MLRFIGGIIFIMGLGLSGLALGGINGLLLGLGTGIGLVGLCLFNE